MLKKFSLIILSLVICLTLCFSVVACGADTSSLQKQIDDLKANNDKLQGELNTLKNNGSDITALENRIKKLEALTTGQTDKLYNVGETVTIYSYGIKMFSIRLVEIYSNFNSPRLIMQVENHNVANFKLNDYFKAKLFIDDKWGVGGDITTVLAPNASTSAFAMTFGSMECNPGILYIGMPVGTSSFITYAKYKIDNYVPYPG